MFASLSVKELKSAIAACEGSYAGLNEKAELVAMLTTLAQEKRFTFEQYSACHSVMARKGQSGLQVLGVKTQDEAKSAFRRLSLLVHPDKSGYPLAEEAFKLLSASYARVKKGDLGGDEDDDPEEEYTEHDLYMDFILRAAMAHAMHGGTFRYGGRGGFPSGVYFDEDDDYFDGDLDDDLADGGEKPYGFDGFVYFCDACGVETKREEDFRSHLAGKRHRTNMAEQGYDDDEDDEEEEEFVCLFCGDQFETSSQADLHFQRTHAKKPTAAKPPSANGRPAAPAAAAATGAAGKPNPAASKFYCDVCNVGMANSASWHAHLNGKKHEAKLAQTSAPRFYCDLCDVEVANEATFHEHLNGKRHAKEARRRA